MLNGEGWTYFKNGSYQSKSWRSYYSEFNYCVYCSFYFTSIIGSNIHVVNRYSYLNNTQHPFSVPTFDISAFSGAVLTLREDHLLIMFLKASAGSGSNTGSGSEVNSVSFSFLLPTVLSYGTKEWVATTAVPFSTYLAGLGLCSWSGYKTGSNKLLYFTSPCRI